ncbi:MAG: LuxR C-terminal-related transcriptional regulator [Coriobacteriia bacterium]|nr:LuxR C-terminal-related transcriptional regulator [Coriobacteriia bacterium]
MERLSRNLNLSKFIPPKTHPEYVRRERLIQRLDLCDNHKCTLLHAPEGYGKASLLSDWYSRTKADNERITLWYRVDTADGDPDCFWSNFIELGNRSWPGIKEAVISSVGLWEQCSYRQLILILANQIVRFSKEHIQYTLIFDRFDSFKLSESETQFFILSAMLPSNVNIIIASKDYPNSRLIEHDAYSTFSLLDVGTLALTRQEAQELLTNKGEYVIEGGFFDLMYTKTEGWPLAVYILKEQIAAGKTPEDAIKELSGKDQYLEAVFKRVPMEVPQTAMRFLLETSFFEVFSTQMCDYVLQGNGAKEVIELLEGVGAFIFPVDSNRHWYRYHYLFAEWLRNQAMTLHLDQVRTLNQRAGSWYRNNKRSLLAAKHIVAASEGSFITSLTNSVFVRSRISDSKLLTWVFELHEADLEKEPYFCLLAAWAFAYSGRPFDAKRWLCLTVASIAEKRIDDTGKRKRSLPAHRQRDLADDSILEARIRITSQVIESKCCTLLGETQAGVDVSSLLLNDMDPLLDDILKMVLYQNLGEAYELRGTVETAGKHFQRAMTIARINGFDFLVGLTRYQLIHLLYIQGRLSEAENLCRIALADCPPDYTVYGALQVSQAQISLMKNRMDDLEASFEQAFLHLSPDRNIDLFLDACVVQSQYLIINKDYSEALTKLALARQAITLSKDTPPRGVAPVVYAQQIRLYIRLNDLDAAEDLLREYDSLLLPHATEGALYHDILTIRIKLERREDTNGLLEELEALARYSLDHRYLLVHIEALLLIVRLCYLDRRIPETGRFLHRALELAKRELILLPFLEEGDLVRLLLRELIGSRGLSYETDRFARKVIAAFDSLASKGVAADVGPDLVAGSPVVESVFVDHWGLTSREGEVLQMLVRGMNRKEIASTLCISRNTTKTHISHIYEKMDVHSIPELLHTMIELEALSVVGS